MRSKRKICSRAAVMFIVVVAIVVSGIKACSESTGYAMRRIQQSGEEYPAELMAALEANEELADFAADYPEKKGKVFAERIDIKGKGDFPLLLQYDEGWGYCYYGDSCVGVSGCGPACLSMVAAGLRGKSACDVTPAAVARFADANGYYVSGAGTSWSLMTEGAAHFGLRGREIPLSRQIMEDAVRQGHPLICSMKPGDFTTSGHFIVIKGIRNGKFEVNDPNSVRRSSLLWDYERLAPQINNMWKFEEK